MLEQLDLFGTEAAPLPLPPGMRLEAAFLSPDEEERLLRAIAQLPLERMDYKGYKALRRVVSYGGSYDFSVGKLEATEPIPAWLEPLRERAAAWAQVDAQDISQVLVAEYQPGTPLGWHRDVPEFEDIIGVSLMGPAIMRLRPWPHEPRKRAADLRLDLAPRSIYLLRGLSRWNWQHSVTPTRSLRYSITLRTRR